MTGRTGIDGRLADPRHGHRVVCAARRRKSRFATPEEAVAALIGTAKAGDLDELLTLFGPGGQELVSSSDPATGRKNREVFEAAAAEQWRLADFVPTPRN